MSEICYYCSLWVILTQRESLVDSIRTYVSICESYPVLLKFPKMLFHILSHKKTILFLFCLELRNFFLSIYRDEAYNWSRNFWNNIINHWRQLLLEKQAAMHETSNGSRGPISLQFSFFFRYNLIQSFLSRSVPCDDPCSLSAILSNVPLRDSHSNRHSTIS